MPTGGALVGVLLVAFALVLTPGPNMLYLVSRTVTEGRRAGIVSLAGVGAAFVVYLSATNLGLSAVFVAVPDLYTSVKLAGAAYLAWLAFTTLRPGGAPLFPAPGEEQVTGAEPAGARTRARRLFAMGFTTNLLNPKIAILYLSLIPQFERPAAGHLVLQGFVLGLVQIAVSLTVNLAIVLTAGAAARFLARRPAWVRAQRYVMGSVLAGLAAKLATDSSSPALR